MRNEQELKENVAAVEWQLSSGDRAEIDRIFEEERVPTYSTAEQAL
jgi:aryl-alcohol dehydrogenase-like predicted oxidoreductase